MPKLCVLNWDMTRWTGSNWLEFGSIDHSNAIEYLKTQGLIINQDIFNVAAPQMLMNLSYWNNWRQLEKECKNEIWEIKVKQLCMLPYIPQRRTKIMKYIIKEEHILQMVFYIIKSHIYILDTSLANQEQPTFFPF